VPQADLYGRSVFINCPFSPDYQPIFRAILFAVYACGYRPRCSLEIRDSGENRLSKIEGIIQQSRFGIHDISFMSLDSRTRLPRFNQGYFARVLIEDGALTWPNGYDWDSVALHDEIKEAGLLRRVDAAK
jgi:hypothetical protein